MKKSILYCLLCLMCLFAHTHTDNDFNNQSGETQGNIQVSELPRGIYMLHLAEKTFKIVLQ